MSSFRKLIPVAAAALMLGLGTNAFAEYAQCRFTSDEHCYTPILNLPANRKASFFADTWFADPASSNYPVIRYDVKGVITGMVYASGTFTGTAYVPLQSTVFSRQLRARGSFISGSWRQQTTQISIGYE